MQDPAFQLQNVLDGNATIFMDVEFLRLFAPQKCCSVLLPLSKSYSPPFFDHDDGNHKKFSIECILYRVAVKLSGQSFCKINALCCGWMLPYGALMGSTTHMMTHNAPHLSFQMISNAGQCSFYHTAIEDNIKYFNPPVSL